MERLVCRILLVVTEKEATAIVAVSVIPGNVCGHDKIGERLNLIPDRPGYQVGFARRHVFLVKRPNNHRSATRSQCAVIYQLLDDRLRAIRRWGISVLSYR